MKPEQARKRGISPDDVQVTSSGPKWFVWVADPSRPGGKRVLTEGGVYYASQWKGHLRRITEAS